MPPTSKSTPMQRLKRAYNTIGRAVEEKARLKTLVEKSGLRYFQRSADIATHHLERMHRAFRVEAYLISDSGALSAADMADVLSLPLKTVRGQIARGRREKEFRRRLSPSDVFATLWAEAEQASCGVVYEEGENPKLADHSVVRADHCVIRLFRAKERMPPGNTGNIHFDPDVETCPGMDCITVAHEYGHHLSHLEGWDPPNMQCVVDKADFEPFTLSPDDAQAIIDSEERAWGIGREVLDRLGVTEFAEFDAEEELRLAGYRTNLAALLRRIAEQRSA